MRVVVTASAGVPVDTVTLAAHLPEATLVPYALSRRGERYDEDEIVAALREADAVFLRVGDLTAGVLARLPRLKAIVLHGTGLDQVDLVAAAAHGIAVSNTRGANTSAVVELTLGLMLALLRQIPHSDAALRQGVGWDTARVVGSELNGKTVGIIGYGRTGQGVAAVCTALGASVLVHSRTQPCLVQLLACSDLVSLHLPLTDETRGLLNRTRLFSFKDGALLVNVARGGLLDLDALAEALACGKLGGAALDVFPQEPPDVSHPLFDLPNVIVSPHAAGSTRECLTRIAQQGAQEIRRLLQEARR